MHRATAAPVAPPPLLPELTFDGEVVVAETPEEIDATVQRLRRLCAIQVIRAKKKGKKKNHKIEGVSFQTLGTSQRQARAPHQPDTA
jgi:hypothetical protein